MRGNDAKSHSVDEKEVKNSMTRSVKGDKDGHGAVFLFSQKWPSRLSGDNFLRRVRKITKRPTTTTQCKIFCRSGYHLEILPNGMVRGTVDQDSKYGKYSRFWHVPIFIQPVLSYLHLGLQFNAWKKKV